MLQSPLGKVELLKNFSSMGVYSSQHFPGFPQLWQRGIGAGLLAPTGSATCVEVCLPITECTCGQDPF